MKNLLFFTFFLSLLACNNANQEKEIPNVLPSKGNQFAYPVKYAQFEMGDAALSQRVSQLWKDYDNNDLDAHRDYFADSMTMEFPGYSSSGPIDSMLAGAKADRASVDKVESEILAIMSVKSTDSESMDMVLIWGSEKRIGMDGKIDSSKMHEVWGFNKEGKVDYMAQYRQ